MNKKANLAKVALSLGLLVASGAFAQDDADHRPRLQYTANEYCKPRFQERFGHEVTIDIDRNIIAPGVPGRRVYRANSNLNDICTHIPGIAGRGGAVQERMSVVNRIELRQDDSKGTGFDLTLNGNTIRMTAKFEEVTIPSGSGSIIGRIREMFNAH